jgi:hypothetical protein
MHNQQDHHFELSYKSVTMQVEKLQLPDYIAFRIVFSSQRPPLVVAKTTNANAATFWTSIPESRQAEADGIGKLLDEHFSQKKDKECVI